MLRNSSGSNNLVKRIREIAGSIEILLAFVAIVVVFSFLSPVFLKPQNLLNILMHVSVIGIISVGMTFVILSAGIDLSVGSVVALSGVVSAEFMLAITAGQNITAVLAVLVAMASGTVIGAINGSLISTWNIPPFIVTLGTMGIARGLALALSGGRSVYGFSNAIVFLGQGDIFGIPMPVIIFLFTVIIAHFVLFHTRFGLYTKVVGDNEMAARTTGINIRRQKLKVYALSGFLASVSGIIYMARINAAEPMAGNMYELDAIAAVIIGGTSLFGGAGTIIGTLIGTLIMGVLRNGLNLMAISPYYQRIAIGAVVIGAVLLEKVRNET